MTFNRLSDSMSRLESIINHMGNGIDVFSRYMRKLQAQATFNTQQDEINYIKHELLPSLKTAKQWFDIMKNCADKLLEQVNHDLERCVADVRSKNLELNTVSEKITTIQKELDRNQEDIRILEQLCKTRMRKLSNAEDILSIARNKLLNARETQVDTILIGAVTTLGSVVLKTVFPPAILGVYCGLSTTFSIGLGALQYLIKVCQNNIDTARSDVLSSRNDLEVSMKNKEKMAQDIAELVKEKNKTEEEKTKVLKEAEIIKEYQFRCVSLNESIKGFYREICNLTGRVRVLHMETDDGYSLTMLKEPSFVVLDSLFSVLSCPALCDASSLNIERLTKQLRAIESGTSEYSFYTICFI